MKKALDCYSQITDAFDYLCSSWLRLDLADGTRKEAINIAGASAYLFDNLFAEEDAGSDITRAVYEDLRSSYDPKELSAKATSLRLGMDKVLYEKGGTPFRDYYRWILPSEPDLENALKDNAGLLAFATIDAFVSLLAEQNKEVSAGRSAQNGVLNLTRRLHTVLLSQYGPHIPFLTTKPN